MLSEVGRASTPPPHTPTKPHQQGAGSAWSAVVPTDIPNQPANVNAGALPGGQFLDGGMGQIGLQWQQVTIDCPIRIVNNVLSVTVSGTNSRGVVVQDVTFV